MTGRCYCGAYRVEITAPPQVVTYCHCSDCRRITAAPVAAFAAFGPGTVEIVPYVAPAKPVTAGVTRWFCKDCGSQLKAEYDYLPGQSYVPLGILDQIDQLNPTLHCHAEAAPKWLEIKDDLPRMTGSGRSQLV